MSYGYKGKSQVSRFFDTLKTRNKWFHEEFRSCEFKVSYEKRAYQSNCYSFKREVLPFSL